MVEELRVDVDGLAAGAAVSEAIAAGLTTPVDIASGSQPSHHGVSAMNEAIAVVRRQQADQVRRQAEAMLAGANKYRGTDSQSAAELAESV